MTHRQVENQWRYGKASHPAPNIRSTKIRSKILASNFGDQDFILHIDNISTDQTINTEYYSSLQLKLANSLKENLHVKFSKGNLVLARQSKVHRAIAKHK